MRPHVRLLAGVVLLPAVAAGQAPAQASNVEAELRRCRTISDIAARTACYDAIVLPPAAPSGAASGVGPSRAVAAASSAPPAATAAVVPAANASASAAALREFGLPERPAVPVLESVDSSIQGEFDGWTAGARLRLANGQVWEIVDGSTASYRLRDPKVRISRGLLGSFFISIEGVAQSPRVRRVQ